MKHYMIPLPGKLHWENLNKEMIRLQYFYDESFNKASVVFDFKECDYMSPTGAIFILLWRDDLKESGIETYYKNLGGRLSNFLKEFGIFPKDDSEDIYNKYMIKMHRCMSVKECSRVSSEIIKKAIIRDELTEGTYSAIDYMINEIWDNAGVHGYECYDYENYPKPVCFGAYVYKDKIEICIADRGQGIHNSLVKNNENLRGCSEGESLLKAIRYGVSGHPKGSPGFGLYSARQFLLNGKGCLNIWSSGYYLYASSNIRLRKCPFKKGTIVSFIIYKSSTIPFSKILEDPIHGERNERDYIEEMIEGVII